MITVSSPTQLPDVFIQVRYENVDIEKLSRKYNLTLGDLYVYRKAKYEILAVEVL